MKKIPIESLIAFGKNYYRELWSSPAQWNSLTQKKNTLKKPKKQAKLPIQRFLKAWIFKSTYEKIDQYRNIEVYSSIYKMYIVQYRNR